jgi:hypothetical protein
VCTTQDDISAPWNMDTLDISVLESWTRPLNRINTSILEDMKRVEDMTPKQILRAGVRADGELCQAYLVAGLTLMSYKAKSSTGNPVFPKVVDGIPCFRRKRGLKPKDDFDEKLGRIDINDCWVLSKCLITQLLLTSKAIFVDGQDMLEAILRCIKEAKYIVLELTDEHIDMIDPDFNSHRRRHGATAVCHAFIVKHAVTEKIIIIYSCFQISTNIGGVSQYDLFCLFIL